MEYSINRSVRQYIFRIIFHFIIFLFFLLVIIMQYKKQKQSYDGRWRNPKVRQIGYTPLLTIWKPEGRTALADKISLWYDEIEALRLKFLDGMHIVEAAEMMWISKSLFANIINKALWKVAEGLVFGKIIQVEYEEKDGNFYEPIL